MVVEGLSSKVLGVFSWSFVCTPPDRVQHRPHLSRVGPGYLSAMRGGIQIVATAKVVVDPKKKTRADLHRFSSPKVPISVPQRTFPAAATSGQVQLSTQGCLQPTRRRYVLSLTCMVSYHAGTDVC